MTESLYATIARLYQETSIGNGTATGGIVDLMMAGAAASRQVLVWETSKDPFRTLRDERQPIHAAYRLRSSHQVDISLAAWIITRHCYDRGGGQWDIRRIGMPSPSFCLQFQLEDGDTVEFRGAHLDEIQISCTDGRAVTMELSWHAMSRVTGEALETATQAWTSDRAVSTNESAATFITGTLTDRATDAIPVYNAEWIMRRELRPVQFGPDGQPGAIRDAPWEVLGELTLPASATTEAAEEGQTGAFGLWVGPSGADLAITSDNVKAFLQDEPLKSPELRDHQLTFEFRPSTTGRLINISATI